MHSIFLRISSSIQWWNLENLEPPELEDKFLNFLKFWMELSAKCILFPVTRKLRFSKVYKLFLRERPTLATMACENDGWLGPSPNERDSGRDRRPRPIRRFARGERRHHAVEVTWTSCFLSWRRTQWMGIVKGKRRQCPGVNKQKKKKKFTNVMARQKSCEEERDVYNDGFRHL